jgi:23S rRNA (cytidine1920-2'-O)/16S rRNA (cytidine1409-2'-O)-methyltransferase
MSPAPRRTLDVVLVEEGLATDLDVARQLIQEGRVLVAGAPAFTAASRIAKGDQVRVVTKPRFVSRGGDKLDQALEVFEVDVAGRAALDAGASTGGFTECLLARGARRVLSVDVGTNQLHERVRGDPRVVCLEQTNVLSVTAVTVLDAIGERATIVTMDLSFTSIVRPAEHLVGLSPAGTSLVALIKPQFEVDRVAASRGRGVITDPAFWLDALLTGASAFERAGAGIMGLVASRLKGATGNVEFFAHAIVGAPTRGGATLEAIARDAIEGVRP